jgi:hypothetical protein
MNDNWMIGKLLDPPGGWRFGFPLEFDPDPGESLRDWMVRKGYPVENVDFAMKWLRVIG